MEEGRDWRLVVGLGNPGERYAGTRHNIGWMVLDRLRERRGWPDFRLGGPDTGGEFYGIGWKVGRYVPNSFWKPANRPVAGSVDRRDGPAVAVSGLLHDREGDAGAGEGGAAWWLVKPLWYMNRSGAALTAWLDRQPDFGLDAARRSGWIRPPVPDSLPSAGNETAPLAEDEDPFAAMAEAGCGEGEAERLAREARATEACRRMLAVVDDIRLPLGKVRFRAGGTDGGHNGLADLTRALETENYPRLRLGVGAPPPGADQVAWVLGRFEGPDEARLPAAVDFAAEAVEYWLEAGLEAAQSRYNGREAPETTNGA